MNTGKQTVESRISAADIGKRKNTTPIVALTAYTTPMAQRLDDQVDLLLVGDSLAMVIYGMGTTVGVSLETMIAHGQAVMRGSRQACVIIDLPAGTYEGSPAKAVKSARKVIDETGASGVKLEGGTAMAGQIEAIVSAGIPVLGHIGLLPQKVTKAGGYKIQGKTADQAAELRRDAAELANAGIFALVLECVPPTLAAEITAAVDVPTIGIGAGPDCDGQILVTNDMLGMNDDIAPSFVKRYAEIGTAMRRAFETYRDEVTAGKYPAK